MSTATISEAWQQSVFGIAVVFEIQRRREFGSFPGVQFLTGCSEFPASGLTQRRLATFAGRAENITGVP
ncbi:MAG TPA: hypothetical protein DC058_12335 [Planctomycetaceae bacterium]|nr:hypothetical protein [Planctomycetaceae bacterium]